MNITTFGAILVGVTLLILGSFYFMPITVPFGMWGMSDEMAEHMDGDEHDEYEHGNVREHNDNIATHEISPSDVVKKVRADEDVILLDVRTLEEYEEVHLENALLLPVQELSQETLTSIGLGEDMKDKEIIIYCRSGARSQTAYNIMESLGYTNIKSVAGGMVHWQEDQYPLIESGEYTGVMVTQEDGDEEAQAANGPKVAFDRMSHNFGNIPQYGGTVETTFTVTNEGNEDLEIDTLSTSCACTKAEISKKTIPAGNDAVLTVVFDPNLHAEPEGVFERTVFVPTNDPAVAEAEVVISVDIIEGQ